MPMLFRFTCLLDLEDHLLIHPCFVCHEEVKCWLEQNQLKKKTAKSEVVIFGPNLVDTYIKYVLGPCSTNLQFQIRNLSVIFESAITFDHHNEYSEKLLFSIEGYC